MEPRPKPRKMGRPSKFNTFDTALKPFGGLLAFLLRRDTSDPRPTVHQLTKELQALGGIPVSRRSVMHWIERAYREASPKKETASVLAGNSSAGDRSVQHSPAGDTEVVSPA